MGRGVQKSFYRDWAQSREDLPLFYRPAWLDCVCGEANWQVAIAQDEDGNVCGVLPFYESKTWFGRSVSNPPFSPFMGPLLFLSEENQSNFSKYSFEKKILQELIRSLPEAASVKLKWRPENQNWLPFYWAGYRQTTAYTFVISGDTGIEAAFENLKNSVRADIEFARRRCEVSESDDLAAFYRLYSSVFEKQKKKSPFTFGRFSKTDDFLKLENRRLILLVKDSETGEPEAGAYLAEDEKRIYLAATGKSEEAGRGAVALAVWTAIQKSLEKKKSLDFEGSMLPGVEHFFRAFGGQMETYFVVFKYARLLALLRILAGKKN